MKHLVYVDNGGGHGAFITAAMRVGYLSADQIPSEEEVQHLFSSYFVRYRPGEVRLLKKEESAVYWCGLMGTRGIVLRGWRHFLHLYHFSQSDFIFYLVPRLHIPWGFPGTYYKRLVRGVKRDFTRLQSVLLSAMEESKR